MWFKRKKSEDKQEHRKHQRVDLFQSSFCKLDQDDTQSESQDCWINNISLGGICFDIKNDFLGAGDRVVVLYKISNKFRRDRVVVKHYSRALNNFRCGCEFIDDDPERDNVISKHIASLNKSD